MALGNILLSLGFLIVFKCYGSYKTYLREVREINQVYNAFETLDFWSEKDKVYNIKKSGDRVELYLGIDEKYYELKRINKRGNNLSMVHYNVYNVIEVSNNPILLDIEDFKVYKKRNLIYIDIKKGGNRYIKCL